MNTLSKNPQYPLDALMLEETREFALEMQLGLLARALAPWPRRSAPLLDVNCGDGAFLPLLWQCGFDVQATEEDAELRTMAATRKIAGLQIFGATDADLPFEDDAFDWVILHLRKAATDDIEMNIQECMRLARRGFMLTFWNSISLAAVLWKIMHNRIWADNAQSWRNVCKLAVNLRAGRLTCLATLTGPVCSWKRKSRFGGINTWFTGLPLGAWCIVRIDINATYPVTSLPIRMASGMSQPQPLMEYAQKNNSLHHN